MVYADEIIQAAGRYGLSNVRVFGSTVHGRDTESSDIDLIVATAASTSLFDLAGFATDVEDLTGFTVDVLTENQVADPRMSHALDGAVPL